MLKLRPPDPSLVQQLDIQDAGLQVRGSWGKVPWPRSGRLRAGSRLGFSSFIWKGEVYACKPHGSPAENVAGCLYIAGGIRNQHLTQKHHYHDLFCLDFDDVDG